MGVKIMKTSPPTPLLKERGFGACYYKISI